MSSQALLVPFVLLGTAFANDFDRDPPERVARVAHLSGKATVETATGASNPAIVNWPMTSGDALETHGGARAELDIGVAMLRLDGDAMVAITSLSHDSAHLTLEAGRVAIHVAQLPTGEALELHVATTRLHVRTPGDYSVAVSPGAGSVATVRKGELHIDTGVVRFQQFSGETTNIAADGAVMVVPAEPHDDFDRWAARRQRHANGERSSVHVARGLVGFQDLDAHGTWRFEPQHGMVWAPTKVAAEWAPYRFGQWVWKDPWGWTWVDDAPWGFAPSHYGRWAYLRNGWHWLPGPRRISPVYAPALVSWTEDSADPDRVGWFPLGPSEAYAPPYRSSKQHAHRLNIFSRSRAHAEFAPSVAPTHHNAASITWAARQTFHVHPPRHDLPTERLASEQHP